MKKKLLALPAAMSRGNFNHEQKAYVRTQGLQQTLLERKRMLKKF